MEKKPAYRTKIVWLHRLGGGYFAKLMVNSAVFRWCALGFVFLVVGLGLSLPKIWRVTPPDFIPVVRISGLDWLQAKSLRRTAEKYAKEGRFEEAAYTWRTALANNLGDPGMHRAALQSLIGYGVVNPKLFEYHSFSIVWLLRLTGTNRQDVDLAAQACHSQRVNDQVLALLRPFEANLNEVERPLYLEAFFLDGQISRFAELLGKSTGAADPEFSLYVAAYRLGWGAASQMEEARTTLEAAENDPKQRVLAAELRLMAVAQRGDIVDYDRQLRRLAEWKADRLRHHMLHWRLLVTSGKKDEATRLAESNQLKPESPVDLIQLAGIYWQFGLPKRAAETFQESISRFGYSPEVWVNYANLLIAARRWDELRAVALKIRDDSRVQGILASHSHFLEGRAEHGLDRPQSAKAAFARASAEELDLPGVAVRDATLMAELGYPEEAGQLLSRVQSKTGENMEFWMAFFQAAYEIKDPRLMRAGAAKCLELQPENPLAINNYAAALLVAREQVAEALRHTLRLHAQTPNVLAFQFNHGFALLLNGRTEEAAEIFKTIDTRPLDHRQLTYYHLARFEIAVNLHRVEAARSELSQIDPAQLFPAQAKWLQAAQSQLPAPAGRG
ncbi:MAG TPA: hypothetical protein VHH73_14760 [Verrucomicrobiae bacterium]|nr:hypothetical protein [Verrucomicrobiae bacterium]